MPITESKRKYTISRLTVRSQRRSPRISSRWSFIARPCCCYSYRFRRVIGPIPLKKGCEILEAYRQQKDVDPSPPILGPILHAAPARQATDGATMAGESQ